MVSIHCIIHVHSQFTVSETIIFSESQVLNGSNLPPWYGPVILENVMCNGTERIGIECATPGPGVVTSPECYDPYRTAGVQCFGSEYMEENRAII